MSHSRTLSIICAVLLQTCIICRAAGADAGDDTPVIVKIEHMEMCLYGEKRSREKLPVRIEELEKSAFGKTNSGALTTRVEKLESVIGKNHAQFIPSEAPKLDRVDARKIAADDGMPKFAPSISETLRRANAKQSPHGPSPLVGNATMYGAEHGLAPQALQSTAYAATPNGQTCGVMQRYGAFSSPIPIYQQQARIGPPTDQRWQQAGNELAGSVPQAALNTALSGGHFSAGTLLNAVHCPLCRLLSP